MRCIRKTGIIRAWSLFVVREVSSGSLASIRPTQLYPEIAFAEKQPEDVVANCFNAKYFFPNVFRTHCWMCGEQFYKILSYRENSTSYTVLILKENFKDYTIFSIGLLELGKTMYKYFLGFCKICQSFNNSVGKYWTMWILLIYKYVACRQI